MYWHQWPFRAGWEMQAGPSCSTWNLPRTTSGVERDLRLAEQPAPRHAGLLAIRARRLTDYEALADACVAAGYSVAPLLKDQPLSLRGPLAVLWNTETAEGHELAQLEHDVRRFAPAPLIALVGFPRRDEVCRLHAAGAAAVLSKPFLLTDLWRGLRDVLTGQPPARAA